MHNLIQAFKSFVDTQPNIESCGLVYLNDQNQEQFAPCENINREANHFFTIAPKDYLKISQLGRITGVFHSHVNDNPEFSPFDYQQAFVHSLDYYLWDVKTSKLQILNAKNNKYAKYLNKQFAEGSSDCFTLVQNFYKNELKINIPNFFADRDLRFLSVQKELLKNMEFLNLATELGFKQINSEFCNFDLLFFNFGGRIHIGIYLKEDCILHQPRHQKSCIEKYTSEYQANLIAVLRYE